MSNVYMFWPCSVQVWMDLRICFRSITRFWKRTPVSSWSLKTTGPCSHWCPVSNWGCVWVWHCSSLIRGSPLYHCMLYKIRCKAMHPLNGALPGPYVPMRVTRGALVTHRYTYAPPRCRTSQYSRTFIPLSVSLWNDLANPVFDGVWLAGFKSRAIVFLLK